MKKTIINLGVAMFVFSATLTSAQTTPTPVSNSDPRLQNQKLGQVLKEKMEERKESSSTTNAIKELRELKDKMSSSTKERMGASLETLRRVLVNQVKRMLDRIQATIDRQKMIAEKITTRIEKIKSAGGNTADSEKYVAEAKSHTNEAQTLLNSMKEASSTIASIIDMGRKSSTTAKELQKAKGVVSEIERHLRFAHNLMVKAVANLRGMSDKAKATTTNSN